MNTLSEYLLPMVFVMVFIFISIRKGVNKKREEEMAKTMLPGRKSGEEIAIPEPVAAPAVQKTANVSQRPASGQLSSPVYVSEESSIPVVKDSEEALYEPVLDIEDADAVRKAVIYTEIFKQKNY